MKYILVVMVIISILYVAGKNDIKNAEKYAQSYPQVCIDFEGNTHPCD